MTEDTLFTDTTDTIFAIASGGVRAAIAIMRLSGPATPGILAELACGLPGPRRAVLRLLRNQAREILDQAIVIFMPAPGSYTGEDCAELHLHGGRAVKEAVAQALVGLGARPAEPGEFTRRAFMNGRLDLTEAEGIADLINAETEFQRRQAFRQANGQLTVRLTQWTETLRHVAALQEAIIDFSDQDLPTGIEEDVARQLQDLADAWQLALQEANRGERFRSGLSVVIVGEPNAGKSSLINALAAREVAIVTPIAGTTRDALDVHLDLDGLPVTLTDTAGLRETVDVVEKEGIRIAHGKIRTADIVLVLIDAATGRVPDLPNDLQAEHILQIVNKTDLAPAPSGLLGISTLTGSGLEDLLRELTNCAGRLLVSDSHDTPLTRARHVAALRDALKAIKAALIAPMPELCAEDLRVALGAIGRITGATGPEDLLDDVFRNFCIGK